VIEGAVITFVDITEIKKTRDKLQESETKFRGLFENTDSAVALHEMVLNDQGQPADYIFLEANPAYERFTGLHLADILGKRVTQISPGVEQTHLIATYGNVVQSGESHSFELFYEPRRRYCRVTAFQVGPNRFASVFVDIDDPRSLNRTETTTESAAAGK
jgi:PAS domain S-box-containing protein